MWSCGGRGDHEHFGSSTFLLLEKHWSPLDTKTHGKNRDFEHVNIWDLYIYRHAHTQCIYIYILASKWSFCAWNGHGVLFGLGVLCIAFVFGACGFRDKSHCRQPCDLRSSDECRDVEHGCGLRTTSLGSGPPRGPRTKRGTCMALHCQRYSGGIYAQVAQWKT